MVGRVNLVWQCGEVQGEVVGQLVVLQFRRLRKTAPDFSEIGNESLLEILQRCGTDIVPNDKEKGMGTYAEIGWSAGITTTEKMGLTYPSRANGCSKTALRSTLLAAL